MLLVTVAFPIIVPSTVNVIVLPSVMFVVVAVIVSVSPILPFTGVMVIFVFSIAAVFPVITLLVPVLVTALSPVFLLVVRLLFIIIAWFMLFSRFIALSFPALSFTFIVLFVIVMLFESCCTCIPVFAGLISSTM